MTTGAFRKSGRSAFNLEPFPVWLLLVLLTFPRAQATAIDGMTLQTHIGPRPLIGLSVHEDSKDWRLAQVAISGRRAHPYDTSLSHTIDLL